VCLQISSNFDVNSDTVKTLIESRKTKKLSCDDFEAFESTIDTEYFGIPSAKVILKKACVDVQNQKNLMSFSKDFQFITIINKANDPANNLWLGERTSAFLTDVNVQLRKNATATEKIDEHLLPALDHFPGEERVIQIAHTSFIFSRFLNDPYLPEEKARGIYADITKNAFGKPGRFFVVFRTAEVIYGFLLFSIDQPASCSTIELIAIDSTQKGRGIGRSLIRSMEHHVREAGIGAIQVGTQLDNISALKFYTSSGFHHFEKNSVYHYWPSKG
jgi:ribosomal protein S18 acetylase RimI-like enzyme